MVLDEAAVLTHEHAGVARGLGQQRHREQLVDERAAAGSDAAAIRSCNSTAPIALSSASERDEEVVLAAEAPVERLQREPGAGGDLRDRERGTSRTRSRGRGPRRPAVRAGRRTRLRKPATGRGERHSPPFDGVSSIWQPTRSRAAAATASRRWSRSARSSVRRRGCRGTARRRRRRCRRRTRPSGSRSRWRGDHAGDGLVQPDAAGRAVERASEGEDAAVAGRRASTRLRPDRAPSRRPVRSGARHPSSRRTARRRRRRCRRRRRPSSNRCRTESRRNRGPGR